MRGSFGTFPAGTLTVNLAGCFAIGLVSAVALRGGMSETARLVISIGFLGGFTTYSAFNEEVLAMLRAGATGNAMAYLLITIVGGALAGMAGWGLGAAAGG